MIFNLIILLPLLNATLLLMFAGAAGKKFTNGVSLFFMLITTALSCYVLYFIAFGNVDVFNIFVLLWTWLDLDLLVIDLGGGFDTLSALMLCVVTIVSLGVHIYSLEYMKNDPHLQRFMAYLSLFTFFMIVLVTSNNLIQLFVGWEGVGLCSFLLINFWFTRIQANKAAIKAVIVNRIGDTAIAIAIFLTFKYTGALDFDTCFLVASDLDKGGLNLACIFFFIGAMGKSAQIGLHTWLPDAMEGPTPVSALIHAATMVTAGVYLIVRCSPLFQETTSVLPLMTVVGSLTTFFAATTALTQTDLKKVIAYSTCSQLGYMVTACGLSAYHVSVFHLSNHAFFKALLFLTAGSIIHALSNEQDMRKMGGIVNILPFSYAMILIGSLALMGFPFLSGYYSKDVILEIAYAKFTVTGHFAFWLGSISAMLTSFYSIRLIFLTFLGEVNSSKIVITKAHDAPVLMALPMAVLCIFSIFIGYISKGSMVSIGNRFWGNSIQYSADSYQTFLLAEFLPFQIKIIPIIFSISGLFFAVIYYSYFIQSFNIFQLPKPHYYLYNILNKKWYFDKMYNEFLIQNFLVFGYKASHKSIDRGILEITGPTGGQGFIGVMSTILIKKETGLVYDYFNNFISGFFFLSLMCLYFVFEVPFELALSIVVYFVYKKK